MKVRNNVFKAIYDMSDMQNVVQDTHGNVSMRDGDKIWIKPSGVPYYEVRLDDVCCVNMDDGVPHANVKKPSVDTPHHIAIYRNNPDVQAICHTHSPYAVAFAAMYKYIHCYTTEHADYFGTSIRCLQYADLNDWGKEVEIGCGEKAILLGRHGALTFGKDACEAVSLAAALENVARKNHLINQIGICTPFRDAAKWHRRYTNDYGQ